MLVDALGYGSTPVMFPKIFAGLESITYRIAPIKLSPSHFSQEYVPLHHVQNQPYRNNSLQRLAVNEKGNSGSFQYR
jgi:hypothetical protein